MVVLTPNQNPEGSLCLSLNATAARRKRIISERPPLPGMTNANAWAAPIRSADQPSKLLCR